jgi:hypothetical protein
VLTKARERAVTMCWAVDDEDLLRRWGGARGGVDAGRLRVLGSIEEVRDRAAEMFQRSGRSRDH